MGLNLPMGMNMPLGMGKKRNTLFFSLPLSPPYRPHIPLFVCMKWELLPYCAARRTLSWHPVLPAVPSHTHRPLPHTPHPAWSSPPRRHEHEQHEQHEQHDGHRSRPAHAPAALARIVPRHHPQQVRERGREAKPGLVWAV